MVLSLQGAMASGKTTTARYIETHVPGVTVSYENPAPMLARAKSANLNQTIPEDFIQIQRIFIEAEIARYKSLRGYDKVVTDLGAEEIEFFTLHYPRSIGMDCDAERLLARELAALRECRLDGILFLDASVETLRRNKQEDSSRKRGFFEHYITNLLEAKRAWFMNKPNVQFLNVDGLSPDEVGEETVRWLNGYIS